MKRGLGGHPRVPTYSLRDERSSQSQRTRLLAWAEQGGYLSSQLLRGQLRSIRGGLPSKWTGERRTASLTGGVGEGAPTGNYASVSGPVTP